MNDLPAALVAVLPIIVIWDIVWKGVGMWKAARKNDKLWFVLLLIFNTVGILPIIYIFYVSEGKSTQKTSEETLYR